MDTQIESVKKFLSLSKPSAWSKTLPIFQPATIDVSIVTTCKGRLHHLKHSAQAWARQDNGYLQYEHIIVDFDCPDGTTHWVRSYIPQSVISCIQGKPYFHMPLARNLGLAIARGKFIIMSDADVIPPISGLQYLVKCMEDRGFPPVLVLGRCAWTGSCIVHRDTLARVFGYNEAFRGYGGDDVDLYLRIYRGLHGQEWVPNFLNAWEAGFQLIQHGDGERVRFFAGKDVDKARRKSGEHAGNIEVFQSLLLNPVNLSECKWVVEHNGEHMSM